MNKKRGGSLFFIPYLCSILYHLYSILFPYGLFPFGLIFMQKKTALLGGGLSLNNLELTYFPGFDPSIISGAGLNFSVRDGKR